MTYEDAEQAYILELQTELAELKTFIEQKDAKIAELGRLNTLLQERDGEFSIH